VLLGTIASIWRYPVKSLRSEPLDEAEIEATGVRGDRTSAYVVRTADHPRAGKAFRGKENPTLHLASTDHGVRGIAVEAGVDVERRDGGRFFDDAPISLLVDRWLDPLSAHVGYPVEPLRFRPNLFIAASPEFSLDESALEGRTLAVGTVLLFVSEAIGRCVVPTYDVHGAASDPRVLRFIAGERDNKMGVYCEVVRPGFVRLGDSVESS
jgi:uncharacterized protein YcbX